MILYCNTDGVLQLVWLELGCNTKYCIVARQLGTLSAQGAQAGRAGTAWAGRAGARQAHGRKGRRGARERRRARGARARARHRRWARGLAKGCALGALSLFLARFDSVFFLSRIFGHCS